VIACAVAGQALGLSASFPARLLALLALGAAVLLYGLPAHHPYDSVGAANFTTITRGVLVLFLAALLFERGDLQTLVLVAGTAAAVLDAVDGWLARRTRMTSAFGARFDMETDALFVLILSLWAWHLDKAGAWILGIGLMRYGFVLAGLFVPAMRAPLPTSFRRKGVAVFQMVALLFVVAPFVPMPVSALIGAAALLTLSLSFFADTRWLLTR
jgi:phosphatidylglycerophosphate synthase